MNKETIKFTIQLSVMILPFVATILLAYRYQMITTGWAIFMCLLLSIMICLWGISCQLQEMISHINKEDKEDNGRVHNRPKKE